MSQYTHLSTPDPEFLARYEEKLKKEQDPSPATTSENVRVDPIAGMRREAREIWVAQAEKAYGHLLPDKGAYNVIDHKVPVQGGTIVVRAVVPTAHSDTKFPVLAYMHGGGWINGNIDVDLNKLILLAVEHNLVAVNVDYRLSPEHPFPIPAHDCLAAVRWVANHSEQLRADLRKGFIVMGSSAGGHLAAVTARRACNDDELRTSPVTGQILQVPVICHPDAYPEQYKDQLLSFEGIGDVPNLTKELMRWAWDKFHCEPHHPDASPLLGSFEGLPPMFIQVAGMDPLRDEGLLYERLARESGIDTKLAIYPGVPHSFETEYYDITMAEKYNKDLNDGVRWLLQKRT